MKIDSPLTQTFLSKLSSATKAEKQQAQVRINSEGKDLVDVYRGAQSEGASLAASKAKSSAEIADEATNAIYEIRQEQLALAKRADDINDEESRAAIQTEIDNLDAEVIRIAAEQDGAGNGVLDAQALEVSSDTQLNLSDRTSLGNASGVDVTSITGASSAVDTFTNLVESSREAKTGTSSTKGKAEDKLNEIVAVEKEARLSDSSKIQDIEEAEKAVKDIAVQVANQAKEDAINVSNLVPERVGSLLSG